MADFCQFQFFLLTCKSCTVYFPMYFQHLCFCKIEKNGRKFHRLEWTCGRNDISQRMKLDSVTKNFVSIRWIPDLNLEETRYNSQSELELLSLNIFVDFLVLPHRFLNNVCNGAMILFATFSLAQYLLLFQSLTLKSVSYHKRHRHYYYNYY